MPTRRDMLLLLGAGLAASGPVYAAGPATVKVGLLEFGTVGWEVETIHRSKLDMAAGIRIQSAKLASNDAAKIAFLGGAVDTIVTDLLWAARMRGEGRNLVFLPFSTAEGALMVSGASPVHSVSDLPGKAVGVAGGPLDKNWLLLQAMARKAASLDLVAATRPAFGAPPLLSHLLEAGQLDAALLYWNFCARLEAKGFKRVIGSDDIARAIGIEGPISFLGYVFDADRLSGRAGAIEAFASASRQAKRVLASSDEAWLPLRPTMQADDEATFETLKRRFIEGIPSRPVADERADAERLYAILAELGGEKLVGPVQRLPPGLYWTGA